MAISAPIELVLGPVMRTNGLESRKNPNLGKLTGFAGDVGRKRSNYFLSSGGSIEGSHYERFQYSKQS
jgi:hypothetical protein